MNSLQQRHEVRLRGLPAPVPPGWSGARRAPPQPSVRDLERVGPVACPASGATWQLESAQADFVFLLQRIHPPAHQGGTL